MSVKIILGLGAGQCGTKLLAQVLDAQPNTHVTHEQPPLLPWQPSKQIPGIVERLARLRRDAQTKFVGDVASFYLPYVEEAIACDPEIRLICLKRPEQEIVAAFCRFLDESAPFPTNHWSKEPASGWYHDPIWTRVFPQYDTPDREEGLRLYWNEYYDAAEKLARRYPENFRIFDTETFTNERSVREVLTFAGVPHGDQVVITGSRPSADVLNRPSAPQTRFRHPMDPRKCIILVPFTGFIHPECDDALKELERRGYPVRRVGGYAAIDQGRNQMATDALMQGFEETMWIDSDVVFHPDAVDQLRAHSKPIVCGIYPQKGKLALASHIVPGTPNMIFGERGGLTELLYAGTGFLLIRRSVYLTIQRKLNLQMCNERFGHPMIPFFQPLIRQIDDGYWYLAEDYAFCQRARECGFSIDADTSIRLWHIGNYKYGWEDAGMERPRFATFTLNFSGSPAKPQDSFVERDTAIANFAAERLWPAKKPDVPAPPHRQWLFPGTQQILSQTVDRDARLVVELGSWLGRSTRYLTTLAPHATIIAVDHWKGSPEHYDDPELVEFLPNLYDAFISECWDYRDRIIPVRADSTDGLRQIADAGLKPDIVYIDADHQFDSVRADLSTALDMFPNAKIVGDDWNWDSVRRAVEAVAQERNLRIEATETGWRVAT